jgi:hypothetical protein
MDRVRRRRRLEAFVSISDRGRTQMTDECLKEELARRLLGWKAVPDRFIKSGRSWIPRWRFNPMGSLDDAFLLLDQTGGSFTLGVGPDGVFTARVRIGDRLGAVSGDPKARTITLAIARALGIESVA